MKTIMMTMLSIVSITFAPPVAAPPVVGMGAQPAAGAKPGAKPGAGAGAKDGGLLLHLSFDEGKGELAKDASSHKRVASVHGAKWIEGHKGKALRFDGDDDFVDCGDAADFDFGERTDFTIAFWMRTQTEKNNLYLVSKKLRSDATEPGFSITLAPSGRPAVNIADGQHRLIMVAQTDIRDGTWHHVVLVADRDAQAVLYVDGQAEANKPMDMILDVTNRHRRLRIGDRAYDNDYEGDIDDVRIWRVAKGIGTIE